MDEEIVLIGAGPSGVSAAIQLKRYGFEPLLFEKEEIGGLLKNAHLVENYPGFPEGVSGYELTQLLKRHLESLEVEVRFEDVSELDYRKGMFFVKTQRRIVTSNLVVIASGTNPRKLPFPHMPPEALKHVFYEIYPLSQVTDEKIAIIGSGDMAFDCALDLALKGNQVTILNRGKKAKCLPLLWRRATSSERICYRQNIRLRNIQCHDKGLVLTCDGCMGDYEFDVRYLIVAIGRDPNLCFLSEDLKKNLKSLRRAKRLYLIGDVKNGIYRQTAICVGDGVKTAMKIHRKIAGEGSCGW